MQSWLFKLINLNNLCFYNIHPVCDHEKCCILLHLPVCLKTFYLQLLLLFVILRDNICQITPCAFFFFCWSPPFYSALQHLLYIQFLGFPAAYSLVHSVPQKCAGLSGIPMNLHEDKSFVQKWLLLQDYWPPLQCLWRSQIVLYEPVIHFSKHP